MESESTMIHPMSLISKHLNSLPILGIILFIFSTSFPPLDLITQINLPAHMGQHALIALSGVLIAYPIYFKRKAIGRVASKNYAVSSIFAIAAILIFWHMPLAWDAAVLNPAVHAVEHFSFLFVGILIGWYFPALSDNFKFMTVFLAASAHMVYGIYLFVMPTAVYPLYPVNQQYLLGIFMIFPAPVYFISMMVISLHRETNRLEMIDSLSGAPKMNFGSKRESKQKHTGLGRIIVPAASLILIVIFVGYLLVTAGMIYFPSASATGGAQVSQHVATIYIVETPVTWNYIPASVTVVIGVNNTVTWISHSLSEDTVSSSIGLFNSVVHPGESWSYTFSTPGVYHYRCDFHPWMQGTVTVLAAKS